MNPAGPIHDDFIGYLTKWSVFSTANEEILVRVQSGIDLRELESRPEPDIAWVRARHYLDGHPNANDVHLLIEVSDSSLRFDAAEKAELYSRAQIPEYWIVDAKAHEVRVHLQPGETRCGEISTFRLGDSVAPQCSEESVLELNALFTKDAH